MIDSPIQYLSLLNGSDGIVGGLALKKVISSIPGFANAAEPIDVIVDGR